METSHEISLSDLDDLVSSVPLPAMPETAISLLELSQDPTMTPADFAKVIETDAALSTQVLSFVNSAYFGFRRKIASVKQGIALVGIRTIKNYVLWTAVFDTMPDPKLPDFHQESFRCDALRRGLFAKSLAKSLKVPDIDEVFTAALLQDIAIPILTREMPEIYSIFFQQRDGGYVRLSTVERAQFGWTHADAACKIFERWNLPPSLGDLIQPHTQLELCSDRPEDVGKKAVAISALLPSENDSEWSEFERFEQAWKDLGIKNEPQPTEILERIDSEFSEMAATLNVNGNVRPLSEQMAESATQLVMK